MSMFLKLLRMFVLKNERSTNILLKCKHNHLIAYKFRNYSFHRQIKFNIQEYYSIKPPSISKNYSSTNNLQPKIDFEQACNDTLESLFEYFDQIVEDSSQLDNPDITFSDGVLTIKLGEPYGTYVINRQTPNKQIWLSSPKSGPKRYDFNGTKWIYKHDGVSLHELLNNELSTIFSVDVNFLECALSGVINK